MDSTQATRLKDIEPATLGERIRAARVARGLTQGQVAGDIVSVGYISRIEAGQRRPDAAVLDAIASRLGVSVDQLLLGVSASETDEIRLSLNYAELSLESGEPAEAERQTAELLASPVLASMRDLADRARYIHARSLEVLGRLDDAIADFEDLCELGSGSAVWTSATIALSRCHRETGDFARAIEVGERTLADLNEAGLGACDEAVQITVTIAAAFYERGDVGHAVRLCRRAVAQAEDSGSRQARASAYWNASIMESHRGSAAAAIPLAERALALLAEGSDTRNLARLRMQLGRMQLRVDPPEVAAAEANLRRGKRELAAGSGDAADLVQCDILLARVQLLSGDHAQARALAAASGAAAAEVSPLLAADAYVVEGQAAAGEGDWEAAKRAYRAGVAVLTASGADRAAGQLWFELGGLLDGVGDSEAARDAYRSAAAAVGLRSAATSSVKA